MNLGGGMKNFLLAAAMLFSLSSFTYADEIKPYIGIGLGGFSLELAASGVNQKNAVLGGFLKLGAQFNEYLSAEMRYGRTGSGTASYPAGTPITTSLGTIPSPLPFDFTMQASYLVSLLVKPHMMVAQNFRLYALLGGTAVRVKGTFSVPGVPSTSGLSSGYSYGGGAEYKMSEHIDMGVEWVQYWNNVKTGATSSANISGISGFISYAF